MRVFGRVQGVGFRAWTEEQAAELGLDGWVRNRRDGSLEALFVGPAAVVEEMIRRCHRGPRLARVERVAVEDVEEKLDVPAGFRTLPTL